MFLFLISFLYQSQSLVFFKSTSTTKCFQSAIVESNLVFERKIIIILHYNLTEYWWLLTMWKKSYEQLNGNYFLFKNIKLCLYVCFIFIPVWSSFSAKWRNGQICVVFPVVLQVKLILWNIILMLAVAYIWSLNQFLMLFLRIMLKINQNNLGTVNKG